MSHEGVYRQLSFWHDSVPGSLEPGPSLSGDVQADVAIAGAGLTGLWTAYYLNKIDPELTIAICEREIAGFGASGRNGGWASSSGWPAASRPSPCTGPCRRRSTRSAA
jgi:glycine/D-amino acid oxidase-like deaminating enzyme